MGIEIERKFLVKGNKWKSLIKFRQHFKQGYLTSRAGEWSVRVRIVGDQEALITLKHPTNKFATNYEFEYKIPLEDGQSLFNLSDFKLHKIRYTINMNNLNWTIDYFKGENKPLILAEIELNSSKEKIDIPSWCYHEVTGLTEWNNASLAQNPISNWSIKERLNKGGGR